MFDFDFETHHNMHLNKLAKSQYEDDSYAQLLKRDQADEDADYHEKEYKHD